MPAIGVLQFVLHGVPCPARRRILPLGGVDPGHVRHGDAPAVYSAVSGITLRLHPGRRDKAARLDGVGTEHLDLSALQGLLRHGAGVVRVELVILRPFRVRYGLLQRFDLVRAADPRVVVVLRRVVLLDHLHLPFFQGVGVLRVGEGVRVRKNGVLISQVRPRVPPLLLVHGPPRRCVPGLDLSGGVSV